MARKVNEAWCIRREEGGFRRTKLSDILVAGSSGPVDDSLRLVSGLLALVSISSNSRLSLTYTQVALVV